MNGTPRLRYGRPRRTVRVRQLAYQESPSPSPSTVSVLPGGRFEARNQTFENLARLAFGFEGVDPRNGMVDTPRFFWPENDRFDVTAVSDREWSTPPPGERVPPESHYLRTALVFETASPKYDWLNRIVGVGVGRREPEFAVYDVFEVL